MPDNGSPARPSVPFEEVTSDDYAQVFARGCTAVPTSRGHLLQGRCPRCGDPMDFLVVTEVWQNITTATASAEDTSSPSDELPLLCTCSQLHPGRPTDEEGCGAYWNVVVSDEPS